MLQQENKVNADVIIAHNVKTSGNVAATFHIEPSHNPKAGERSQAWFALTKQGGEVVSLDRCHCSLNVYDRQRNLVLQPALESISAEQYQGIPGADITFPKAGIYQLEISGTPKDGQSFNSFALVYDVTVQAGQSSSQAVDPATQTAPPPNQQDSSLLYLIVLLTLLSSGAFWFVKRNAKK